MVSMVEGGYETLSQMIGHLEESARTAAALEENPIAIDDWKDQIRLCKAAVAFKRPQLTKRAKTLIKKLEQFKP